MERPSSAIDDWIRSEKSSAAVNLKRLYELQAEFLFDQYEPIQATPSENGLPFIDRLDRWLSCFDDQNHRWTAFNTLKYLFFAGQDETEEMYRCAIHHSLTRWLIDKSNIDIFDSRANELLADEMKACWPCPITDSLRINSLLHRTGLPGQSLRPDWLSLKQFGDPQKIAAYVTRKSIRYLVLLEDFVGSGSQCERATRFALNNFDGPILLIPLVICAPGNTVLKNLEAEAHGKLTVNPVIILTNDCLVSQNPNPGQPKSFPDLRLAMAGGYKKIGLDLDGEEFGHGYVGSLYSSYSNCPNNAPPIFHQASEAWPHALFPRKTRA